MTHVFRARHLKLFLFSFSLVACQSNEQNLLQGSGAAIADPAEPTPEAPSVQRPATTPQPQVPDNAVHEATVQTGEAGLPPNHPPLEVVAGSAQGIAWAAPSEWTSQPPSSEMRLAQWALPGSTPAECAVFHFAGGGTAQDNVQRWVRQFEPTPGVVDEEAQQAEIESNGLTITLVRAGGTYLAQGPTMEGPVERRPDHRLFGAITTIGEQMYFLKCVGPDATMQTHESGMVSLARSLQAANAAEP
jgi:hypothetical protein